MKRPTLNSGLLRGWLSAVAVACAPQVQAQPSPTEPPQTARPPASVAGQALTEPATTRPRLSPWAKEILKLSRAGVSRNVMEAFIDNAGVFALGADQIIYLTDLGVPEDIIQRMLQHDRDLISGATPLTVVSEPPYEPLVFTIPAAENHSPAPRVAAPPTTARPVSPDGGVTPGAKTAPPAVIMSQTRAQTSVAERERTAATTAPSAPAIRKRNSGYPVREPQPVELLPPILFINAHEPEPNTLVIVGFPRG